MPISKINPDGTVKIYNSNTGEIKDVKPEELGSYNGKLVGQYQALIQGVRNVKSGQQKVGDLPQEERGIVATSLTESGFVPKDDKKDKTEGERTKYNLGKTGLQSLKKVSEMYSKDPDVLSKQLLPGKFLTRSFDSALFGAVDTLLRIRTGATAPEEEIRRYISAYGPKFGDTAEDAEFKMNNLRTALVSEGGIADDEANKLFPQNKQQKKLVVKSPLNTQGQLPIGPAVDSLGKIGGAAAGFLIPRIKEALTQGPQQIEQNAAQRPNAQGNLLQSIINSAQQTGDLARTAVPAGIEAGLLASPLSKLGLLKGGAVAGGITGGIQPSQSPQETGQNIGQGVLGGGLTGGLLKGGGSVISGIAKSSNRLISQLFKPAASALQDFRKNTGLDFSKEVIKRDLPSIKGKSGDEVLTYYNSKVDEFNNAADTFLADKNTAVNRGDIVKIIDDEINQLGGVNRIGQSPAIKQLTEKRQEILSKPENLSLVDINQFKRDFQDLSGGAIGGGESTSVTSKAYDNVQRSLNNYIETKAPGVKDINKSVQFYRLGRDSIQKTQDATAKSEGGLVSQLLTGGGLAGAGFGLATGNPLIAGAALTPALANILYRSPKFKSAAADVTNKAGDLQLPNFLKNLLITQGGRMGSGL